MTDIKLPKVPNNGAGKTELNTGNSTSKVDAFSGQHTTSLIIAGLFVIVFIAYVSVICFKAITPEGFNTSMISILTLLIGFFTGTKAKKE